SLSRLSERRFGIYRRFHVLLEAAAATGARLRIVATVPSAELSELPTDPGSAFARELRDNWKVDANVVVGVRAAPRTSPWIVQQMDEAFGFSRSAFYRTAYSPSVMKLIADELSKGPSFIVAHRLMAMFALTEATQKLPPTFFDLDDVEHLMA